MTTGYNFENYKELYNTCSMSFCGTEPFYYKTMAVKSIFCYNVVRQYCLAHFSYKKAGIIFYNKQIAHMYCFTFYFIFPGNKKNYIQMHDKLYYFVTSL